MWQGELKSSLGGLTNFDGRGEKGGIRTIKVCAWRSRGNHAQKIVGSGRVNGKNPVVEVDNSSTQ